MFVEKTRDHRGYGINIQEIGEYLEIERDNGYKLEIESCFNSFPCSPTRTKEKKKKRVIEAPNHLR